MATSESDEKSSVEPASSSVEPVDTPLLRVVKGDPTPEELGALVAVVASLGGPAAVEPQPAALVWNHPRRLQRVVLRHGPDAWRISSLPR
jgi:hypothetical protein